MFTKDCGKHAEERGAFEVDRASLMRMNRLYSGDELFHWCSTLVSQKVFQSPGKICDQKEEAEKRKRQQQQQSSEGDGDSERKEDGGDEEEEDDPVAQAWDENLPLVLAASESQGFGIATSRKAWITALHQVAAVEAQFGVVSATVPPAPEERDELKLHSIEPRMVRVFFAPSGGEWMVALPVVLRVRPGPHQDSTAEKVKLQLLSLDVMVDSMSSDVAWWVLPEQDVYVYAAGACDRPDPVTHYPVSKVQRCLAERAREQINSATMSWTNLTNGSPPIMLEQKDGGGARKKHRGEGSGEVDGQSNDDARLGPSSSSAHDSLVVSKAIIAGAPAIVDAPSPYNEFIDHGKRRREQEQQDSATQDDWAVLGLHYTPQDDGNILGTQHLRDRIVQLQEGRTVGQTQLPVPPAYYNEQHMRRLHTTAAIWGIPLGVVMNFSIFASGAEGKAGLSALGNKSSGLGGATSSTKSTAWTIWEETTNGVATSLERWSRDVLDKMGAAGRDERDRLACAKALDDASTEFDRLYGDETMFYQQLTQIAPDQSHIADNMKEDRKEKKTTHLARAAASYKPEKAKQLMYRLTRTQPIDVLRSLFTEGFLKPEAIIRHMAEQMHLDPADFEEPTAIAKVRSARNEPEPKGADKKKPVAKK